MAIKEIYNSYDDALEGLTNNMSIMIGGFGVQGGQPTNLMIALRLSLIHISEPTRPY